MTEEQMTLIKTLIKKHGISATDGEWTLVFLGASYGLTEKQIASYLIADTSDLLAKHEKMLCILFGIEPESNGEIQRMENPARDCRCSSQSIWLTISQNRVMKK